MADDSGDADPPWDETIAATSGGSRSVGTDAEDGDDGDAGDADAGDEPGGNVAGEFSPSTEVEPGTPSFENALWVAVGALIAVLALPAMFPPFGIGSRQLVLSVAGIAVATLLFMGLFGMLTPDT